MPLEIPIPWTPRFEAVIKRAAQLAMSNGSPHLGFRELRLAVAEAHDACLREIQAELDKATD